MNKQEFANSYSADMSKRKLLGAECACMMEQLLSITYTVYWTVVVDEQRATSLTREVLHVHGKRERECVYVRMCGIRVVRH